MRFHTLAMIFALSLGTSALADGQKYKAPALKTHGKVGGHRMHKGEDGTDHAARFKVQEGPDAEREVASEDKKALPKKMRNPSSDAPAKKKTTGPNGVEYWHVTK